MFPAYNSRGYYHPLSRTMRLHSTTYFIGIFRPCAPVKLRKYENHPIQLTQLRNTRLVYAYASTFDEIEKKEKKNCFFFNFPNHFFGKIVFSTIEQNFCLNLWKKKVNVLSHGGWGPHLYQVTSVPPLKQKSSLFQDWGGSFPGEKTAGGEKKKFSRAGWIMS